MSALGPTVTVGVDTEPLVVMLKRLTAACERVPDIKSHVAEIASGEMFTLERRPLATGETGIRFRARPSPALTVLTEYAELAVASCG